MKLPNEYKIVFNDISIGIPNVSDILRDLNNACLCGCLTDFIQSNPKETQERIKNVFTECYLVEIENDSNKPPMDLKTVALSLNINDLQILFKEVISKRQELLEASSIDVRDLTDLDAPQTLVYKLVMEYPHQIIAYKILQDYGISEIKLLSDLIAHFKVIPRDQEDGK